MKKKCLCMLLAAALSLGMTACGEKKNVDTPQQESEPAVTESEMEPVSEPESEIPSEPESDMPLEETIEDYAGIWKLDQEETQTHLKSAASLSTIFGEAVDTEGGEMTITADGSMTFFIGEGLQGEGSAELTAGWIMTNLDVKHKDAEESMHLIVAPTSLSGERYLVLTIDEEVIYWKWDRELDASDILANPQQEMEILADVTWEVVEQYGLDEYFSLDEEAGKPFLSSALSYTLKNATLMDCGDYYLIAATLNKPVTVTGDLNIGDEVTFVINELTGETASAIYIEEGLLQNPSTGAEYYYWPDNDEVVLTQASDDRVDAPFYEGAVRIRKDATTGAVIADDIHTITEEDLLNEDKNWFNGVSFDEEGYVTALLFFGD